MEIKTLLLSTIALFLIVESTQLLKAGNRYGDCSNPDKEGKNCDCNVKFFPGTCTKTTDNKGLYCQC